MGMANLRAGPTAGDDMATGVSGLFRTRYPEMVRQAPPVSAVVPVKLTIDGKVTWTFVWFGYMKNARNEGIALCSNTDGDNYDGSGSCGAATVGAGKVVGFWDSSSSSAIASRPASGSPAVVNMGGGIVNHAKLSEYYGYAHESVARVVLRLSGSAEYAAQTFAAWPGSGLRLWAFAVPSSALSVKPRQAVLLGYDAAGHVI